MTVSANRPPYLEETLESWSAVRGISDWSFIFAVEPGPFADDCIRLIDRHLDGVRVSVLRNTRRLGVLGNPHFALSRGFEEAEFAVLAEEDIVVSNDVLEYFDFADRTYESDSFALAACTASWPGSPGDLGSCRLWPAFAVHVWGTWRDRWEGILCDTWDFDYSRSGWDLNIGRIMKDRGLQCVLPGMDRSRHIGREGVHINARLYDQIYGQAPPFVRSYAENHWQP